MSNGLTGSIDISVVITLHGEGRLAHHTFKALEEAVSFAKSAGRSVEIVAVLDKVTDRELLQAVERWRDPFDGALVSYEVNFGALSLSRNFGIEKSRGTYISILDGDDLYCREWLLSAHEICSTDQCRIAHPEAIFRFPVDPFIRLHGDNPYAFLDLILENQWSALTMAHRCIFEKIPYIKDDESHAFQDWLWNCQTADAGYLHVIVPKTLMAVRQKLPGKSLWQNSFAKNKVVRPNSLFRKIFLMDYPGEIEALIRNRRSSPLKRWLQKLKLSFSVRALDHLHDRHDPLYQALIYLKRQFASRMEHFCGYSKNYAWTYDRISELEEIEPAINPPRRIQIRRSNSNLRSPFIVTPQMSELVRAEKPLIYILPNVGWNLLFLKSLCYMHATGRPLFVISSESCGGLPVHLLPERSVFIDLSQTGLIFEERLKFLHRLLLQTDPGVIHLVSSPFGLELLARYPGTFANFKIFGSFFASEDETELNSLSCYLSNFPHLTDFFRRISTDTDTYRNRLTAVLHFPESMISCHSVPCDSLTARSNTSQVTSEFHSWARFQEQVLEFYDLTSTSSLALDEA